MTQQRIARRKTLIEAACIVGFGCLASWLSVGAIEWASRWLVGR